MADRKFELGQIVQTRGVYNKTREDRCFDIFVRMSLKRHRECDWGDLCEEDKQANEVALISGDRLMSEYVFSVYEVLDYTDWTNDKETNRPWVPWKTEEKDPKDGKIWIITEADRSTTTILFPSEY